MDKLKKVLAAMLLCVSMVMMAGAGTAKAETEITLHGLHFDKETYTFWDDAGNTYEISDEAIEMLEAGWKCVVTVGGAVGATANDIFIYMYPSNYDICGELGYCFYLLENGEFVKNTVLVYRSKYEWYSETNKWEHQYSEYYNANMWLDTSAAFDPTAIEGGLIYSDVDIPKIKVTYDSNNKVYKSEFVGTLLYEVGNYDIREWCADAGLNCAASSNESSSVIPFWFNEKYIYIVRKCITPSQTSSTWLMSMIYYSDDSVHYPYHRKVNDLGYIGLASASEKTQTITVRNFVYDEAGAGWLLQEKTDCEINSSAPVTAISNSEMLSDNVVMIYSSCDIYTDANKSAIWFQESGSFYDVEIKLPEITTAPIGGSSGSGSSSSGSSGTGGGALAFIISIMSMIWTDICGIPMNIDGYTITLQQIVVYAIIATILGGLFIKMIFGKKG